VEADGRGEHLEVADIADVLSLDEDTAVRVVDSLQEAGYLTGVTVDQPPYLLRIQPTTEARRASGQWPVPGSEMYDRLLQVLDERIAAEPDERAPACSRRVRQSLTSGAAFSPA
jgi:DNA-binding MarR family transcriptional regulator